MNSQHQRHFGEIAGVGDRWWLRFVSLGCVFVMLFGLALVAAPQPRAGAASSASTSVSSLGATLASPTVAGRPSDPPIGVPLETLSSNPTGAIRIDDLPVPNTAARDSTLEYAVISRSTRAVEASGSEPYIDSGVKNLSAIAAKYDTGDKYLMIVSGISGIPDDATVADLLQKLGKSVGASLDGSDLFAVFHQQPFSIVGIPGGPPGSAWVDIRYNRTPDHLAADNGDITGYLQVNSSTDQYNYVSPELTTFNTSASSSAMENTMTLHTNGGTVNYSAALPAGYTAGFQVLVLDPLTLQLISNRAVPTNGNGSQSAADIAQIQEQFGFAFNWIASSAPSRRNPLVLVQSIGHPKGQYPGWAGSPYTDPNSGAAHGIGILGGSRTIFDQLNGTTDDYSLVGGAYMAPAMAIEASSDSGRPGPISGVLARGRTYSFQPIVGGAPTGVNSALIDMTYQAPKAFASFAEAPLQAAETYIGDTLRLCPADTAKCQIRPLYYSSASEKWSTDAGRLRALEYPASAAFTPEAYNFVKDHLVDEFDEVSQVRSYFDALKAPYGTALQNGRVNVRELGNAVDAALRPPPDNKKTSVVLAIVGKLIAVGSAIPPPGNAVAAGLSAVFGVASLLTAPNGDSTLADATGVRAGDLTAEMYARLIDADDSITGMEKLFLSDEGKLQDVYDNRNKEGWKIDDGPAAVNGIVLSTRQWFAEQFIPYTYQWAFLQIGSSDANGMVCESYDQETGDHSYTPWKDMPAGAQQRVTAFYKSDGTPEVGSLYFSGPPGDRERTRNPTTQIADLLFKPVKDPRSGAYGLNLLDFASPHVFGQIRFAKNGAEDCGILPTAASATPGSTSTTTTTTTPTTTTTTGPTTTTTTTVPSTTASSG